MKKKIYNWGIIGPGNIAHRIMEGFKLVPQANVTAVASGTPGKGQAFCDKWGISKNYTSYNELVSDPEIDIVYISTVNNRHMDSTLLAIEHGKHVLCEKPLSINARQAQRMVDASREKGVFLMQAIWSRYLPIMDKLRELLAEGIIGDIKHVTADFAAPVPYDPLNRIYNPELGGGALLDLGIYPLSLACMVYGELPSRVSGLAHTKNGVDTHSVAVLGFDDGRLAAITSGLGYFSRWEAVIYGEKGNIYIPQFWIAKTLEIKLNPEEMKLDSETEKQVINVPFESPGFQYELIEVMECVSRGLKESPLMQLDESIGMAAVMDKLRKQWGIHYPGD